MSEGEFVNMRPHRAAKNGPQDIDESTDTYDTIDWLLKNIPNHNGKVGMWGISYPGFYTAAGMIDAHPALKAASPQAPIVDWFAGDDWHHNGALFLPHAFNFLASFGHPRPEPIKKAPERKFDYGTPDGYAFYLELGPLSNVNKKYFKDDVPFWNEMMRHSNYDDFWAARNLRPHLKNIRPAVMTVGGWFDAENLYGALETYKSVEASTPGATNVLVMGPWLHGGWSRGDGASLGPDPFRLEHIELLPRAYRVPVLPVLPQGQGHAQLPRGLGLRDGNQPVAQVRHLAAAQDAARARFTSRQRAGSVSRRPSQSEGNGLDEYDERPGPARAVHRPALHPDDR